jgi:hypothetical protein
VTPEYGADVPIKASDGQHVYTFAGWDHEVAPVTSDVTYTATYSSKAQTYTVTWVDDKGATLEIDKDVEYGVMPSYDGEEPTKHYLTLKGVRKGLRLMKKEYPHHYADLVEENDDAITGDIWLQLAVFGEVIYG